MGNPILARMKRMTNRQNEVMSILQMAKGNPDAVFENMMKTNPQFAQFVEENKGKTPEQIANHYGVDFTKISQYLR